MTAVFNLPAHLSAKLEPALVEEDERHLAAIAGSVRSSLADAVARLDAERRAPGGGGQAALDRDEEVHRLTARIRALSRYGSDICLGRMVHADEAAPVYVGRMGLTDGAGRRLLVDWRSPAAEPFFGTTHARPMGLVSRRRYRWSRGQVVDYWDEVYAPGGLVGSAALDDHSAFIASLGSSRSEQMRDVLGTIHADQDAIIRAGSEGALVIDGGPGTGKTVVALHRAAYLLYADPRLRGNAAGTSGDVLFVGPHEAYLAYVADVLPSLGEEGVATCTLRQLVPEGAAARAEEDAAVAELKGTAGLVAAIEPAVRFSERPPTGAMTVETPWSDIRLDPDDWIEACSAPDPGTPHNEARAGIWDALLHILADKHEDDDVTAELLGRHLRDDPDLVRALNTAWPLLDPEGVVADLWTVPAYLRLCAPHLSEEEVSRLQRTDGRAWTVADLPLLDAARRRIGDAATMHRKRRYEAQVASEREHMAMVVDNLIRADDDGTGLVTMLRQPDLQDGLVDGSATDWKRTDTYDGPFRHIVVDEAQELTDAQWHMLLARCPSRSLTLAGDPAQARHGFAGTWETRLGRAGLDRVRVARLTVNYRTPAEVMTVAADVIRAALPDANVPTSIRYGGVPVRYARVEHLDGILDGWLAAHPVGTACVIGTSARAPRPRVRFLLPDAVKGLEFDLVVLVGPASFGTGITGAVDRYVAMTRATQQLVILG